MFFGDIEEGGQVASAGGGESSLLVDLSDLTFDFGLIGLEVYGVLGEADDVLVEDDLFLFLHALEEEEEEFVGGDLELFA